MPHQPCCRVWPVFETRQTAQQQSFCPQLHQDLLQAVILNLEPFAEQHQNPERQQSLHHHSLQDSSSISRQYEATILHLCKLGTPFSHQL